MSKHFGCKDCCKYQTDACDNPMYAEIGKHLCPMYVMDIEYCYEKGKADAINEFVDTLRQRAEYLSVGVNSVKHSLILEFENIAEKLKEQNNE